MVSLVKKKEAFSICRKCLRSYGIGALVIYLKADSKDLRNSQKEFLSFFGI